jgi:hypothetical protein
VYFVVKKRIGESIQISGRKKAQKNAGLVFAFLRLLAAMGYHASMANPHSQ